MPIRRTIKWMLSVKIENIHFIYVILYIHKQSIYEPQTIIWQCNIFCVNCSQTIEKRTNLLYD